MRKRNCLPLQLLWTLLRLGAYFSSASSLPEATWPAFSTSTACYHNDCPVLLLDVDNTLYCEQLCGIEAQIRQGIYRYCSTLGVTPEQADAWHEEYGSTVEGLRKHVPGPNILPDFYEQVYADVDVSRLIGPESSRADSTGYSHSAKARLRDLLQSIPHPLYLVSNSPSTHVRTIICALGLDHISWRGVLTPDTTHTTECPYPTKAGHAKRFFQRILDTYPASQCILLDDSKINVNKAQTELGMPGICICKEMPLPAALAVALGHVDPAYSFSDVEYLKAKNMVDVASIHGPTWERLRDCVQNVIESNGVLTIADVGAGLLSMLELILVGGGDKTSLWADRSILKINYYAYESNLALYAACKERLGGLGFTTSTTDAPKPGDQVIFSNDGLNITIFLCMSDFTSISNVDDGSGMPPPQLVVGCCFADLMEPQRLIQSLQGYLRNWKLPPKEVLLYFPITFAGTTQFLPPSSFGVSKIPSDTVAFRLYSDALSNDHGHHLDPDALVRAVQSRGGKLVHRGPSNWNICPEQHPYLWNTMLYFFGTVGASELMKRQWNSVGWIQRAKNEKAKIVVSNVDLLFSLPRVEGIVTCADTYKSCRDQPSKDTLMIDEIQFTASFEVGSTTKTIDTKDGKHLGPNQVEIEAVSSLISSGTELKIFKGLFDDAALDVNIEGMADERMTYPLAYGYSLVGRVTRCGSHCPELMGRLVFTFSPHSSHVICDRSSIHVVPDGISAEDAMFMPSMETALSLVHDAHVRVGERVAVYGQGLIGLLVTAILSRSSVGDTVTVFDAIPDRLAAAASMGASAALLPSSDAGPFDVSIEISGNARALQSAIDHTRNGGRVIVGSWYGNSDVTLKLGIDFHRSHKTIKTSQVSDIPAELSGLWSKPRRFAVTWELIQMIKPSRLVTRTTTLLRAQEAYDALDKGEEIAVAFRYHE